MSSINNFKIERIAGSGILNPRTGTFQYKYMFKNLSDGSVYVIRADDELEARCIFTELYHSNKCDETHRGQF